MHNLHLAILAFGLIAAGLIIVSYYWAQDRIDFGLILSTIGYGFLLGLAALAAIYGTYFLFSIIVATYIACFFYIKNHIEFNRSTESAMLSLLGGTVVGISGFVGCVICA